VLAVRQLKRFVLSIMGAEWLSFSWWQIDIAEITDRVQALWASVVGVSPLPNVLVIHW